MPFYPGVNLKKLGVKTIQELKSRPDLMDLLPDYSKTCLKFCGKPRTYSREEAEAVYKIIFDSNDQMKIFIVGSYRRGNKSLNDVDLLVLGDEEDFVLPSKGIKVLLKGERKIMCLVKVAPKNYIRVDITFTDQKSLPFALLHFTGSLVSNINLRKVAIGMGYKLNQYGLFTKTGRMVKGDFQTEEDIYKKLKKDYESPSNRNH